MIGKFFKFSGSFVKFYWNSRNRVADLEPVNWVLTHRLAWLPLFNHSRLKTEKGTRREGHCWSTAANNVKVNIMLLADKA